MTVDQCRDILQGALGGDIELLCQRYARCRVKKFIKSNFELSGLRELPIPIRPGPCVYCLCSGDAVVYVGQSINVLGRVCQHLGSKQFDQAFVFECDPIQMDSVEMFLIRTLKPPLNRTWGELRG